MLRLYVVAPVILHVCVGLNSITLPCVETQDVASLRCCTRDIAYLRWFKQHRVAVCRETQDVASLHCCTHDIAYLHWFKQHHVVCVETQDVASLRCCTHDIAYLRWFKQHHVAVCRDARYCVSTLLHP